MGGFPFRVFLRLCFFCRKEIVNRFERIIESVLFCEEMEKIFLLKKHFFQFLQRRKYPCGISLPVFNLAGRHRRNVLPEGRPKHTDTSRASRKDISFRVKIKPGTKISLRSIRQDNRIFLRDFCFGVDASVNLERVPIKGILRTPFYHTVCGDKPVSFRVFRNVQCPNRDTENFGGLLTVKP